MFFLVVYSLPMCYYVRIYSIIDDFAVLATPSTLVNQIVRKITDFWKFQLCGQLSLTVLVFSQIDQPDWVGVIGASKNAASGVRFFGRY